ncbi:Mediator of RNA polymerase II transcription subunit 7 [Dispira parvispora]|uniref:Mediator of RNA polymerase II transcription subunit 7 n=1 Tax=Dispira parvispora TaxID=1520584 RepID=A0A9W8E7P9_9FUNG|nr:Mediator of RNA polymerase II transcription subunit 7 [Dispira parvispora]
MADANANANSQQTLDTAFPPPPDYFRQFTTANLDKLNDCQQSDAPIPPELTCLVPPPLPTDPEYFMFGRRWLINDLLPSLAEQDVEQLYPEEGYNRMQELTRLNDRLVFKFLDLVETLAVSPEGFAKHVEAIRLTLVNMHHLINEYRPYQARQTLGLILEDQIQRRCQSAEDINSGCAKLQSDLNQTRQSTADKIEQVQKVLTTDTVWKAPSPTGPTSPPPSTLQQKLMAPASLLDLAHMVEQEYETKQEISG